ncbi:hypothetical protein D3C72_1388480 [compost metagenome]
MDRTTILLIQILDPVYGITNYIEYTTFDFFTNRHFDRSSSINNFHSANQTFSCVHGNCTYTILT